MDIGFWSGVVIGLAGGAVSVTKFYLDYLKIKELRLKIKSLEQSNSPIIKPTPAEVEQYSKKSDSSPGESGCGCTLISLLGFLLIGLSGFFTWSVYNFPWQTVWSNTTIRNATLALGCVIFILIQHFIRNLIWKSLKEDLVNLEKTHS